MGHEPLTLVSPGKLTLQLRDSQTQVDAMATELRRLRAHLLHAGPLIAVDTEIKVLPSAGSFEWDERPSRNPTLGDAEAEHLLLAGKTLSHVRRINRVPLERGSTSRQGLEATPRPSRRFKGKSVVRGSDYDEPADSPRQAPTSQQVLTTPGRRRASNSEDPHFAFGPGTKADTPSEGVADLLQATQDVAGSAEAVDVDDGPAPTIAASRKRRKVASSGGGWRPSSAAALHRVAHESDSEGDEVGAETDNDQDAEFEPDEEYVEADAEGEDDEDAKDFSGLNVLAQASASQHATSSVSPQGRRRKTARPATEAAAAAASATDDDKVIKRHRSPYVKVRFSSLFAILDATLTLAVCCLRSGCSTRTNCYCAPSFVTACDGIS